MTALAHALPAFGRSLERALRLGDAQAVALAESLTRLAERQAGAKLAAKLATAMRTHERRFADQLAPLFARLGQHVAAAADTAGGLIVEAADPSRDARKRVDQILAASGLDTWAARNLKPVYEQRYLAVARQVVETVNAEISLALNLPDPVANKIIAEGGRRLGLLDLSADTRSALYRVIAQARAEGLGAKQIGRLIREQVPAGRFVNAGPRYRAELIGRTETLHAQRYSSLEVYRAADTVTAVRMFDNLGGFGDAECISRDGQIVSFDDAEAEMANEHPNGTLGFAPVAGGGA